MFLLCDPLWFGWEQVMCRLYMFGQAFEALEVMERGGFE